MFQLNVVNQNVADCHKSVVPCAKYPHFFVTHFCGQYENFWGVFTQNLECKVETPHEKFDYEPLNNFETMLTTAFTSIFLLTRY